MTAIQLTPAQRKDHRAAAHHLAPVVMIGGDGLTPAVQKEVEQLFSVLRFAPSRLAFTGLWQPIEEAPPEEIAAFFTRWRHSRFEIQRAGYQALTQLVQASWYDNPTSWAAIGYPGPPKLS